MKTTEMKLDVRELLRLLNLRLERLNPFVLMVAGLVCLVVLAVLLFAGGASKQQNDATLNRAKQSMGQVTGMVQNLRRVLEDQQVQELAVIAVDDPAKLANLQQYISGRITELLSAELYGTELDNLRAADLQPFGYALLDMLLVAQESGIAPAQIHGTGANAYLAMAARVGEEASPAGYLLIRVNPAALTSAFQQSLPEAGAFALDQYNGQARPMVLSPLAVPPKSSERLTWLRIPSALFRIGVVQSVGASVSMGILRPMFFIVGLFLLCLGVMLKLHPSRPPEEATEDPEHLEPLAESTASTDATFTDKPEASPPAGQGANDGLGVIDLPDLGFNLEKMAVPHKKALPPVELVESIFRAYDIRGIVGETLDADVARQVGQCVGSIAVDKDAGPVVVARDGRESGSDLVAGMIEGIASTGCDVIDIGAVPTGVLYFAAYELGSGTGVMVTGSHNPPDYNGFKILIGGVTWAGEQITDMFTRIQSGNLRVGKGKISEQDMLDSYRERISGDIQLKKPLKIVVDCGNGIGRRIAPGILRAIGCDVIEPCSRGRR